MRLLHNNIFNNFEYTFSSEDDFFPISNMFNYQTLEVGKFASETEGTLALLGNGIINEIAIFNTNADKIKLEITDINNDTFTYTISIINKQAIHNISPINFRNVKITFTKKSDSRMLECGYLIIGEGIDFPPHDKQKTHTVNYTHNQYFSLTGHYFYRKLPFKSYDTWKVSFPYLTNADRDKIINFFDISNFEPFVLQVWIEENIPSDGETVIKYAKYNKSKYNRSKYASKEKNIKANFNKYYMKSGLYVCTNDKIDFKKGKNDLYQYSTELTFREIK